METAKVQDDVASSADRKRAAQIKAKNSVKTRDGFRMGAAVALLASAADTGLLLKRRKSR